MSETDRDELFAAWMAGNRHLDHETCRLAWCAAWAAAEERAREAMDLELRDANLRRGHGGLVL